MRNAKFLIVVFCPMLFAMVGTAESITDSSGFKILAGSDSVLNGVASINGKPTFPVSIALSATDFRDITAVSLPKRFLSVRIL